MKYTLLLIISLLLYGCGSRNKPSTETEQIAEPAEPIAIVQDTTDTEVVEPETLTIIEPTANNSTSGKSSNDIRFGGWTEKDWHDNDYIRHLRKCFDDYRENGVIPDIADLQDYKSLLANQFFMYEAQPFLLGGMYLTIGFINDPHTLYDAVIYSHIEDVAGIQTVTGFTLTGFFKSESTSSLTKEEILEIIQENPDVKLW